VTLPRTSAELFTELDDALARAQQLRDELARRFGFDPETLQPLPEEPSPAPASIPAPQGGRLNNCNLAAPPIICSTESCPTRPPAVDSRHRCPRPKLHQSDACKKESRK
jgi:hypothetical protein